MLPGAVGTQTGSDGGAARLYSVELGHHEEPQVALICWPASARHLRRGLPSRPRPHLVESSSPTARRSRMATSRCRTVRDSAGSSMLTSSPPPGRRLTGNPGNDSRYHRGRTLTARKDHRMSSGSPSEDSTSIAFVPAIGRRARTDSWEEQKVSTYRRIREAVDAEPGMTPRASRTISSMRPRLLRYLPPVDPDLNAFLSENGSRRAISPTSTPRSSRSWRCQTGLGIPTSSGTAS